MKKWLLLIALFPLFCLPLKADLGSCVVYHAKFYLKDGRIFNACFEVAGYFEGTRLDENNTNPFCNNAGVFRLFKKEQRENGQVPVYKSLRTVRPRPLRRAKDDYQPNYGFVLRSERLLLDSNSIVKLVFRRAEGSKRDWYTSRVLLGTSGIFDTIQQQRYWNRLVFAIRTDRPDNLDIEEHNLISGPYDGFALYNYNPRINVAELKRLARLKFPLDEKALRQAFVQKYKLRDDQAWPPELIHLYDKTLAQKAQSIGEWLWKKGILLVVINGTC